MARKGKGWLTEMTKSLYQALMMCPWRIYARDELGIELISGAAATIGIDIHHLWEMVCTSKMTTEEAFLQAGSDEVREGLELAINHDPFWGNGHDQFLYELSGGASRNGNLQKNREAGRSFWKWRLDRLGKLDGEIGLVQDLKTGRWKKDFELERHMYVWAARLYMPSLTHFMFQYYYSRDGDIREFEYIWNSPNEVVVVDPLGEEKVLTSKGGTDPLLKWLETKTKWVEANIDWTKPKAGRHCESFFGTPCQFFGSGCPLSGNVAVVIHPELAVVEPADIMALPPEKRAGAAFLYVKEADIADINIELAELAMEGVREIGAGAKTVADKVQSWVGASNIPSISYGGKDYGFVPDIKKAVNKELVLQLMASNDWSIGDIARVINVSESSLNKCLVAQKEFVDTLKLAAISHEDKGKTKWGEIKPEEE